MESEKKEGVNTCLCDLCIQQGDGNNCKFYGFDLIELPVYCNGFEPKAPQFTDEELKTLSIIIKTKYCGLTKIILERTSENPNIIYDEETTEIYRHKRDIVCSIHDKLESVLKVKN